jgi:hypothetical protein
MRKSTAAFGAVAVAALVAAAGSALTNSNTLPGNDTGTVGYGATTVTGVTVSNISYVADVVDGSKLASVVVTSTDLTNAPGTTGTLTLRDGSNAVLTTEGCGTATPDIVLLPTEYRWTCLLAPQVNAADVATVGFTVTGESA